MSAIQTISGRMIDPLAPDWRQICIEDIAHSLSNQGRFTGHTKSPRLFGRDLYTTAEHSVHVAELCPDHCKLEGLLHDGSEAYLSDIASPVKHSSDFRLYREAERRLQEAVMQAFNLHYATAHVEVADHYMLGIEARDLMQGLRRPYWYDIVNPVIGHPLKVVRPWSPRRARREFLKAYEEYRR